jgi:hypothetical protein
MLWSPAMPRARNLASFLLLVHKESAISFGMAL